MLKLEDAAILSNHLSNKFNLKDDDLCFCGSTALFNKCCKITPKYWINNNYIKDVINFSKYNKFNVKNIPISFILKIEKQIPPFFNICATPGCNNICIGSHIFGKSLLKKYFLESKCQWYVIDDAGKKTLTPTGINNEIKYNVFCQGCDDKIFKAIDDPNQDITNSKNQLLHVFRALAYQYQFNRIHLAIAHQILFALIPISTERNNYFKSQPEIENIDCTHFHHCYIRYKYGYNELIKIYKNLEAVNTFNDNLVSRVLESRLPFFAQGFENPHSDLMNNKIMFIENASIVYVIIPENTNNVRVIIWSDNNEYIDLINQLNTVSEYKVRIFFRRLIKEKNTPRSVFVSNDYVTNKHIL